MPQNAKFSQEEIIEAALTIIEECGFEHLSARSLGKELNSSARPIFTTFKNMEEVINKVIDAANKLYQDYVEVGLKSDLPFKGVGISYIQFAIDHPKLFKLLFMKEHSDIPSINNVLGLIEESYQQILNSITTTYKVSENIAISLYQHMWIYCHGIAVLITTKMCKFSSEDISNMMTEVFKSLIKNGGKND